MQNEMCQPEDRAAKFSAEIERPVLYNLLLLVIKYHSQWRSYIKGSAVHICDHIISIDGCWHW